MKAKTEDRARYKVDKLSPEAEESLTRSGENVIIARALEILRKRLQQSETVMECPQDAKNYLQLSHADKEHEVFGALWVSAAGRLIKDEILFRGTLDQAPCYPREVVKSALAANAAGVVFYHNHPSGNPKPSMQDLRLTQVLDKALSIVEVNVLDHLIIGEKVTSLAEIGEL